MKSEESGDSKKQLLQDVRFYVIGLGILLIWGATLVILYVLRDNPELAGSIGDSFGMVNSLFFAGALAFLIYTTHMQRKQLELQQEEMKMQREELGLMREEYAKTVELSRTQLRLNQQKELNFKPPKFHLMELSFKSSISNKPLCRLKCKNSNIKLLDWYWNNCQLEEFDLRQLPKMFVVGQTIWLPFGKAQDIFSVEIVYQDEYGLNVYAQRLKGMFKDDQWAFGITNPFVVSADGSNENQTN